ncbi:2Fe-2S iron-sulfur cluster-binding protein [Nocardioides pacificus]
MPTVRVVEVVRETADAHSLVLEPTGDSSFDYRPGQFLTLRIPSERPGGAARCYSLSSAPGLDERLKVTVKRTRDGYASNWICDHVAEGHEIEVLRPSGTFVPTDLDEDLLLVAGGSGITPVLSILKSVLHSGTGRVHLVYGNRDEASVIFAAELRELAREYDERFSAVHWLESVQGIPTPAALATLLAGHESRRAFVCGPEAFMDLAERVLTGLGAPRDRIHTERFTSLEGDPFAEVEVPVAAAGAATSEVEVTLDGATSTYAWPEQAKLLDVLLAAGVEAPYSCREGACSACACVLTEGEVDLEHNEVLDAADLADGLILACQARPRTERLRVSFDG